MKLTSNFLMAGVSNSIPHISAQIENSGKVADSMVYIRWLLYADDLVMFCKSIVEVKTIMNIPNDTCSRFGLSITISFPKKKTQVFNNDELANLASLFSIGEIVVENVSEFTYLGQTFSNKDQGSRTDLRVSKAIGKFNEMRQVLTDKKVNVTTRTVECFT